MNLRELLDAREERIEKQEKWLKDTNNTLVVLRVNTPGLPKVTETAHEIYNIVKTHLFHEMKEAILKEETSITAEGFIGMFVMSCSPNTAKRYCMELEDGHPLGRFVDLDVYKSAEQAISRGDFGKKPRTCYLCNENAHVCARAKVHTYEELQSYMEKKLEEYLEHRLRTP